MKAATTTYKSLFRTRYSNIDSYAQGSLQTRDNTPASQEVGNVDPLTLRLECGRQQEWNGGECIQQSLNRKDKPPPKSQ